MNVTLYQAPYSSAIPVVWALAELSVPYENVKIDLASGAQKKPEFLALNPNGKVPTLVVDGTPMFEACAIVMWLGDRFGVDKKLWPAADAPARMQAMAWSTWAYVTYGSMLARFATASGRAGKDYAHEKQVGSRATSSGACSASSTRACARRPSCSVLLSRSPT